MTVKELKEKLELLIDEGKGDYELYVDNFIEEELICFSDKNKVVYL